MKEMTLMTPARQAGLSMIEILVSLTIVAFGLLGLAGLQARSLTFQKDSFDRKAAAELAAQMTERIRANYDGFRAGNYNLKMEQGDAPVTPIPACADATNCTAQEVANRDWAMWTADVRRRLPTSAVYLAAPANSVSMNLVMAWQEGKTTQTAVDPVCASVSIADETFQCFQWVIHP